MILGTTSLPFSLVSLLIDEYLIINERSSHRSDKVINDKYGDDILIEYHCNELSNVSPISLVPGTRYALPSITFMKHFKEVN